MKKTWLGLLVFCLTPFWGPAQQVYRLDPAKSVIEIHLDTAGPLRFAGHHHLIKTGIQQGTFNYSPGESAKCAVEVVVNTRSLKVVDPDLSAKDRDKIQATMESNRVLDAKDYPTIVFKSLKFEPVGSNRLRVIGDLTIRNQTHPVVLDVSLQKTGPVLKAAGETSFKQTTFGIQPVTAGLGTVRVGDEMRILFQVVAEQKPSPNP